MTESQQSLKNKIGAFFGRAWGFIKRHKKLCIILVAVVVVAAIVLSLFSNVQGASAGMMQAPQTVTLARMDLQQIVSGTGTLQSSAPREVSSSLSYEVKEIYVKEGDVVQAGQLLAQLDTTDLDKDISTVQKNITDAQEKDALSLAQAERKLQDAINTREINWTKNNENVQKAYNAIDAARVTAATTAGNNALAARSGADATTAANAAVNNPANNTLPDADVTGQTPEAALATAQLLASNAQSTLNATSAQDPSFATCLSECTRLQDLQARAQQQREQVYSTAYNTEYAASQSRNHATVYVPAYDSAYAGADVSAQTATYNTAVETRDTTYRNDSISVENAQDNVNTLKTQDSAATYRTQLEGYQDDKEDCQITAPIAGTVTAMSAEVGKSAGGSSMGSSTAAAAAALFTIENTNSLEITASVPEYDAVIVTPGMRVDITTDAINDTEWLGTVESISPKATDDAGNFTVVVQVTSPTGQLAIGMSAKVNIVTEAKENVFAVPYDAVTTDASGNSVVYVYTESRPEAGAGTPGGTVPSGVPADLQNAAEAGPSGTPVVVQTGMETDYYIEISGTGLTEEMVILADPEGKNVSTDAGMGGFMMGGGF